MENIEFIPNRYSKSEIIEILNKNESLSKFSIIEINTFYGLACLKKAVINGVKWKRGVVIDYNGRFDDEITDIRFEAAENIFLIGTENCYRSIDKCSISKHQFN